MTTPRVEKPYTAATIEINQDETLELNLTLMQINDDNTQSPYDLTHGGVVSSPNLEFIVRPRFDHTVLIKKLTSPAGGLGGIVIDDAAGGKIGLIVAQSTVAAELPVTIEPAYVWEYFLSEIVAPKVTELLRGWFVVYPGRRA